MASDYYIFCGAAVGKGELVLKIKSGSTTLAESSVHIQIKNVTSMYERWTSGENPKVEPGVSALYGTFQYPTPAAGTPCIVFVHGWNMTSAEKTYFSDTAFKRLYWQNYKGDFVAWRWPTDYNFQPGPCPPDIGALTDIMHYDRSEFIAWKSGEQLRKFLSARMTRYSGNVHVFAHSLGNAVVGEALRRSGSTKIAKNYAASQSAIVGHLYDGALASSYLLNFTFLGVKFGPMTPNIYANRLAGNSAALTGRRVNLINPNDYAFQPKIWHLNQLKKPDPIDINTGYFYNGKITDASPWNKFQTITVGSGGGHTVERNLDIVNRLNDRYEAFAFAAESRSFPAGTVSLAGFNNINLKSSLVWGADTGGPNDNGGHTAHKWHSGQFRMTNMRQKGYWKTLLGPDVFQINSN